MDRRDWTEYENGNGRRITEAPGGAPGGPVFLCYHGGGFRAGKPEQLDPLLSVLDPLAGVFVRPEYRADQNRWAALDRAFEDATRAARVVAERHAGRPVVLVGFSAGATVALWQHPVLAPVLQACLLLSPVVDLGPKGFRNKLIPKIGRIDLSPMHALVQDRLQLAAPVMVLHGTEDPVAPAQRSKLFLDIVSPMQPRSRLRLVPQAGHGFYQNKQRLRSFYGEITQFIGGAMAGDQLAAG